MSVLIVVYSFTGNNRLLAQHLAERLRAEVVEVQEPQPRTMFMILLDLVLRRSGRIVALGVDPQGHDHVLFLAPLWNRHIATPMRAAMRQLAPRMRSYSFVTLCGGDRKHQSETVRQEATSATGRPPAHQKEIWLEKQRPVTKEDLATLKPEIEAIIRWFEPEGEGATPR